MANYFHAKKLNILTGRGWIVMLNSDDAYHSDIRAGDMLKINWECHKKNKKECPIPAIVSVNISDKDVKRGQIGLFKDIWKKLPIEDGEPVEVHLLSRPKSIQAIKKKLLGNHLDFAEIDSIIKDIVTHRIGNTEIAYFIAAGFTKSFSNDEIYYLAKSVANNGQMLKFRGTVADKHCIGGISGNRTTMVVVPIIASTGLYIPKTSSRAITSPAGTADTMEALCSVNFSAEQIKAIVKKHHSCIVWGGGVDLAPADDKIIKVSYPLSLEPYDKMIVSIMAKKVAEDVKYLIIDIPVGDTAKVKSIAVAKDIKRKFLYLGKKFGIKMKIVLTNGSEPVGRGIGPSLEARDVLRVLQQKEDLPRDLQDKSIKLAGDLLELVGYEKIKRAAKKFGVSGTAKGWGAKLAREILESGAAWKKMQEIIKAQGGNYLIDSEEVVLSALKKHIHSASSGFVLAIDNKKINDVCRILGAPRDKLAGIYLNKRVGEKIKKGDRLFTLYSPNKDRMRLAEASLKKINIFKIN